MRTTTHRPSSDGTNRSSRSLDQRWLIALVTVLVLVLAACSGGDDAGDDGDEGATDTGETAAEDTADDNTADEGGDEESTDGESVEIRFVGTQPAELIDPVTEQFEESHDGIDVTYESVPFEELSAVIAQRVGGGTQDIDVYYADAPRNPTIVEEGYALDLTDLIGVDALEGVVPEASIETAVIDDRLWTVPMRTSTQLLYYNIDLLEAADIEPPSMDPAERITWEELRDLSEQAQEAGATWGYVDDQVSRYYQFQPLPESQGGGSGLSGPEGTEVDVTNDGWIAATEYWADLYESGLAPRGVEPNDTKPLFFNGEAAFMPGGPWWIPDFSGTEDLNYGIAAYPYFEGGEEVTPTDSEHLAIDPNTEHVDAAVTFVEWITLTEEGALAMASGLAVPSANLEALPQQLAELESTRDTLTGLADLVTYEIDNTAVPRPFSVGYVEFETLIGEALEDIRNGSDVTERLTQAEEDIARAFER
ncbi:ABC transporter substrate-binding protein [Euzebya tangerina]|uniref:ABC transporter substrate-binding protein n=1 Tax=Euzebya tangerina TaxID=591198 RepID=UPI000E317F15|nr:extracellular solute-binding protein [Euzebya tangerina]